MEFSLQLLTGVCFGFVFGIFICLLWFRNWINPTKLRTAFVEREQWEVANEQAQRHLRELNGANVQADLLSQQLAIRRTELTEQQSLLENQRVEIDALKSSYTEAAAEVRHLQERMQAQKLEFEKLRQYSKDEFANISTVLLRQNSQTLREEHTRALKSLLDPMRLRLNEFQAQVDRKFADESKDKATLKAQIDQLTNLNQALAQEAKQLTQALTGDTKTQGDWGELQLERLLEAAGLEAETHFSTQLSFRAEEGRHQRPDCLIHLPGKRCLIIDCKVSLTAYKRFCGSEEKQAQQLALKQHIDSLKAHIKGLSSKRYQDLYQIPSPDYVLLFVPIEPAFIAAVREAPSLFTDALAANVVLVSPSTLLATMRTVSYIWQQENQQQNALEIAEVGAKLYDKFVGFCTDMDNVGTQLTRAQTAYNEAMNKLSRSPKQGTTLLARAEELRKLGIQSKKSLAAQR